MEKPMGGRELFLKAFVANLINASLQNSKNEFNLITNAKNYLAPEVPLLQIPQEIMNKSTDRIIDHATSTHEEDIIGNKINQIISQQTGMPQKATRPLAQRIERPVPVPGQKRISQQPKPTTQQGGDEGYELTQIRFPRPVNVQELDSEDEEGTMQVGALDMEKIAPSKDMPAPVKLKSMKLEPVAQVQAQMQRQNAAMQRVMQPSRPQQALQPSRPPAPTSPGAVKPKQHPSILEELTIFGFAKLDELIQDPSVETIECPGPDKPLLVSRRGRVQPTALTLKSEEIDRIMKEISDKTRIPLSTGIFRAALRRYLVTAVLSEFVGTRFIIQKKPGADSE